MGSENSSSPEGSRPPVGWVTKVFEQLELPLLTYTSRLLQGDTERARDIVQEAFTKLCQQAWPAIQPIAKAWLYRTCRNQAIDFFRREGRVRNSIEPTELSTVVDLANRPPDMQVEEREQVVRIQSNLARLSHRHQEILRLRLVDNLSYKQISEVMGLSVSNVGFLLHQAISTLRQRLSKTN